MGGSNSQRKNESPQHVVYGGPAILAAHRIWHLQQYCNVGGIGRLLQAHLLADDTKGRSEGGGTSPPSPNRPRVLQRGMHPSRSGMFSGPDHQTARTLWMSLGHRPADGRIDGAFNNRAWGVITAPRRIIPQIGEVGHPLVAKVSVGKSGQIQRHHQNCTNPHRSAKNRGQVVYAGGD